MSTTYELKDGQVIPYTAGRRANDTRLWRDATDLELQQHQQISELETELAVKEAECEALREALKAVVKAESLWLPTDVDPEHAHEAHALNALANIVHRTLAGRKEEP